MHTKLIDIELPSRLIKLDNIWYLRIGPNCWYIELDSNFEALDFEDVTNIEKGYQCLKQS